MNESAGKQSSSADADNLSITVNPPNTDLAADAGDVASALRDAAENDNAFAEDDVEAEDAYFRYMDREYNLTPADNNNNDAATASGSSREELDVDISATRVSTDANDATDADFDATDVANNDELDVNVNGYRVDATSVDADVDVNTDDSTTVDISANGDSADYDVNDAIVDADVNDVTVDADVNDVTVDADVYDVNGANVDADVYDVNDANVDADVYDVNGVDANVEDITVDADVYDVNGVDANANDVTVDDDIYDATGAVDVNDIDDDAVDYTSLSNGTRPAVVKVAAAPRAAAFSMASAILAVSVAALML